MNRPPAGASPSVEEHDNLQGCRTASVTRSRRFSPHRRQDVDGVGVRVVRSRTSPATFSRARARSRSWSARPSFRRRSRKSLSTLCWKPGSSRSRPSAYLKSIRHGTGSAAPRSERWSRNCSTLTVARLRRRESRRPVPGYHAAKSSSSRQAVEPVTHPHRRRPGRVAGSRHLRGQLRNLDPSRGRMDITHSSGDLARLTYPRKTGPPTWPQTARRQDPRQSRA